MNSPHAHFAAVPAAFHRLALALTLLLTSTLASNAIVFSQSTVIGSRYVGGTSGFVYETGPGGDLEYKIDYPLANSSGIVQWPYPDRTRPPQPLRAFSASFFASARHQTSSNNIGRSGVAFQFGPGPSVRATMLPIPDPRSGLVVAMGNLITDPTNAIRVYWQSQLIGSLPVSESNLGAADGNTLFVDVSLNGELSVRRTAIDGTSNVILDKVPISFNPDEHWFFGIQQEVTSFPALASTRLSTVNITGVTAPYPISRLGNRSSYQNTADAFDLTFDTLEGNPALVTVTATSSKPEVIDSTNFTFTTTSPTTRRVVMTPRKTAYGEATITLRLDPGAGGPVTLTNYLHLIEQDKTPNIQNFNPITQPQGFTQVLPVKVSHPHWTSVPLVLTVDSFPTNLIDPRAIYVLTDTNNYGTRYLVFTPRLDATGTGDITLRVTDPADGFATSRFSLTTTAGNPTPTVLGSGTAISFNTASTGRQYANESGSAVGTGVGQQTTVEAWVYATALLDTNLNFILYFGQPATGQAGILAVKSDGSPSFANWNNDYYPTNATRKIALNEWHHVAAVMSGTSITLYVDGQRSASGQLPATPGIHAGPIYIGHEPRITGGDRRWIGHLDEIRIWNVARTDQEIADHYNRSVRPDEPGLVRYYRCDEGFVPFAGGDTAYPEARNFFTGRLIDSSTNQRSISLFNFPSYVPGMPTGQPVHVNQDTTSSIGLATVVTGTNAWGNGGVVREIFFGPDSTSLGSGLGSSPGWPANPDVMTANGVGVEVPPGGIGHYGQRIRGLLLAPQSGTYTFAIASAHEGQLFLGTDATAESARMIASSPANNVSFRQFDAQPSQQTAAVSLVAGQSYYFEARHQAGSSGTVTPHLSVQWTLPGGTIESPIPAYRLKPLGTPPAGTSLTTTLDIQPSAGTLSVNGSQGTYQPAPNYFGPDDFAYFVSNGTVNSPAAEVQVQVLNRDPSPVAGSGNALQLGGSPAGVQYGGGFDLSGESFTLELWARRADTTPPGTGNVQALASFSGDASTTKPEATLGWFDNGRFGLQMSATLPTAELISTATYHTNLDWNHWAMVFDASTGRRELFLNGISLGSIQDSSAAVGSGNLYLGSISGKSGFFRGSIDEVRLWTRARSQQQILDAMNTPLVGNEQGLYLYYRFDEGNGLVAYDSSQTKPGGIRFDGTLSNPIIWTTNAAPALTTVNITGNSPGQRIFLPDFAFGRSSITYQITGNPTNGVLTADPLIKGAFIYTPRRTFSGPDSIRYRVISGSLTSSENTLLVQVTPNPIPPTIGSIRDQEQEEEDPPLLIPLVLTDEDQPDGSRLRFTINTTNPKLLPSGSFEVQGSGTARTLSVTPASGEVGEANVEIVVDNQVRTASTTFTVRVNPRLAFAVVNAGSLARKPSSYATALNASGQLAGYVAGTAAPTNSSPFFYNGYGPSERSYITANLGGTTGGALALNTSGIMVGASTDSQNASVAFVVDPRQDSLPTSLGVLPGGNLSVATGINDDGLIVGYAITGDGTFRAFTAGNAPLSPLSLTNGFSSMWATAVNSAGQIAGYARLSNGGNTNGFLYSGGQTMDLGRPTGAEGLLADHVVVTAMSDQTLVVGNGIFASGPRSRVVTYQDGNWSDLGDMFGGGSAEATGVNRFGQIVGRALTNGVWRAFLYSDGQAHDLNALVQGSGWTLSEARGINDRTQIAANGTLTQGANVALVLFPATEIGRRVFRPEGTLAEYPTITLLQKSNGTDNELNSFHWSPVERKLYAIRPVVASIQWHTGTHVLTPNDIQFGTSVIRQIFTNEITIPTLSFNVWPRDPEIHVAGTPAQVQPEDPAFRYGFMEVSYRTSDAAVNSGSSPVFYNPSPGYSVLWYLLTEGRAKNPDTQPNRFSVVRTIDPHDPAYLVTNVSWTVGTPITNALHHDYPGLNGYVLSTNAYYDGAGTNAAYQLSTRRGPILPVNSNDNGKEFLVVWYQQDRLGVSWPSMPTQYSLRWPTNTPSIVIASQLGTGTLLPNLYPRLSLYNQPDPSLPGFNPNEEHAFLADNIVFALRDDLNARISPKASDPFVLLRYLDPASKEWRMKVFSVTAQQHPYYFRYDAVVGREIQPPLPISLLPLMSRSNRVDSGSAWTDHLGRIYANGADVSGSQQDVVIHYFYPLQPGFFYNLDGNQDPPPTDGEPVAWLDRSNGGSEGTPIDVTFSIQWPTEAPVLQVGQSLTTATAGLPDITDMASAKVVFDTGNPSGQRPLSASARLFDPLSPRSVSLEEDFKFPTSLRFQTDPSTGLQIFADLPYYLRVRLHHDPRNRQLTFQGFVYTPSDGAASVTLVNIMSQHEREAILALDSSGDPQFQEVIEDLYALTRNPNRLDLSGDGLPDESLLVGLTSKIATLPDGTSVTNVVAENLQGPKALTAAQPLLHDDLSSKGGLRFSDSGQGMKVDATLTNLVNTFTMEFWVRPEVARSATPETNTGKDSQFNQPFALYPDQGSKVSGLSSRVSAGVSVGTNGVAVVEHGDNQIYSPLVYSGSLSGWHHIAVVYTEATPSLYLDGQFIRTGIQSRNDVQPSASLVQTQDPWGNYGVFRGSISDVRIWNHARTPLAILENATRRLTGQEAGLSGMWLFNEGSGSQVADASPGSHPGTLLGPPTWITDGPQSPPGPGYVVIAENDDPSLGGLPVSLHVIRVDDSLARGSLAIIQPDNVLDERVTLRHTADFAGQPDNFVFQWFYQADANGFDATAVPLVNEDGEITDARNWVAYPTEPESGQGANDLTLGTGAVSSLLTLSDIWYVMRYGEVTPLGRTNWSDWIGDPGAGAGAPRAMFVPGWIKRVLGGINLFAQRGSDFDNNQVNTLASTLAEAGPRYSGAVALNPSTTDNFGLIEIYTTVLNRGRELSIDGNPAVSYEPADKALLFAAGNIADLYLLHANEAFADAFDPTIGLTTDSTALGSMSSSVFAFQNQVSSLMEEELAMLRGRDDTFASVGAPPVYNRLFWNFTGNDGEAAYVASYGIPDQNSDGFINAGDAKILYPQGHGDAWGHYLTALTTYYDLLRHTNFIWTPRPENTLVAGVPIEVNYQDERRFARAAAARARTGAEIVSRIHRLDYTDDPVAQLQGFPDPVHDRAWSVSGWARRAAQGAFFDWVTGNAILPAVDPTNHVGIQRVDRTTVIDLTQIVTESASILTVLDQANAGLNPLGFDRGAVAFDVDPDQLHIGAVRNTHFEQIYQRALRALQNAEFTFNRATVLSSELRKQQNSVSDFSVAVANQELAYLEDLLQIFGYPYNGDMGPGATYPSGYQGPDLFHWMYIPTTDVTDQNNPRSEGFTDLEETLNTLQSTAVTIKGNFAAQFTQETLDAVDPTKVPETEVEYPIHPGDYAFEAPSSWGARRSEGSLQSALRSMVLAQAQLRQALTAYKSHVAEIEEHAQLLELRYDLRREQLGLGGAKVGLTTVYNVALTAANITKVVSQTVGPTSAVAAKGFAEAVPDVTGLAFDVLAPIAAAFYIAEAFAIAGPTALAEEAEVAEKVLELAKEETDLGIELQVETNEQDFELAERLKDLEVLVRSEAALRLDLFNANQAILQAARNVESILAQGQRLLVQRTLYRKVTAGTIQADRYRDLGLRIFRNDALQKFDTQFEIAARYVYLAAAAYDYELNLGDANSAGGTFGPQILRERSLGELVNGQPVVGRVGLASILGRLAQNFDVLKGQIGLNNDRPESSRFSLRSEAFRTLPTLSTNATDNPSDETWRQILQSGVVDDLWNVPEFRRYCRPFAAESSGPQPGIVLRFGTTITAGRNFFDKPLGPLDSSYDPSEYSTRIRSVGVWFSSYDAANLASKPRVYLIPAGTDRLLSADASNFGVRDWNVIDQRIPVPFPIGAADLSNPAGFAVYPAIDGSFAGIRRHSAFRAYQDGAFDIDQFNESSRLVGRSVWNTQWVLIIPAAYLLGDPQQGLDRFIQSVDDIKLYFQTYSVSGN